MNLALVVFLGLKNTPLSPLAGKSYDSINVLHRVCGYTTILYMVLHARSVNKPMDSGASLTA